MLGSVIMSVKMKFMTSEKGLMRNLIVDFMEWRSTIGYGMLRSSRSMDYARVIAGAHLLTPKSTNRDGCTWSGITLLRMRTTTQLVDEVGRFEAMYQIGG